jgi:adenylate kinase
MAPITDEQVGDLKDLVHKLESRVYSLEKRLEGDKKPSLTDSMRMILIGPPGAGEFPGVLT